MVLSYAENNSAEASWCDYVAPRKPRGLSERIGQDHNARRHATMSPFIYAGGSAGKPCKSCTYINLMHKVHNRPQTPKDIVHESSTMVLSYAENDSAEASWCDYVAPRKPRGLSERIGQDHSARRHATMSKNVLHFTFFGISIDNIKI